MAAKALAGLTGRAAANAKRGIRLPVAGAQLDDIAAYLATLHNYSGLWWNAPAGSESGWGLNLAHQGDVIFATWFTCDVDGTPMWLVATAPRTPAETYEGTLYRTTGPAYGATRFDPAAVVATEVGHASFAFADGNDGTFRYTVNGVSQTKAITRQILRSPGTVCR